MYQISFKIQPCESFPAGLSDSIGWDFNSLEAAKRALVTVQADPGAVGMIEELKDASMWVSDDKGNVYE